MPIPTTRKLPFSHNLPLPHLTLFCPLGQFFPQSMPIPTTRKLPFSHNLPFMPIPTTRKLPFSHNLPFSRKLPFSHNLPFFHLTNSNNKETSIQPQSSILSSYPEQQGNFHSATIFHSFILPYFAHLANSCPIFSPISTCPLGQFFPHFLAHLHTHLCPRGQFFPHFLAHLHTHHFAHLANSFPIFSPISTPTSTKHH
nr:hypothetical transcript [Hymenolepis microstoma]